VRGHLALFHTPGQRLLRNPLAPDPLKDLVAKRPPRRIVDKVYENWPIEAAPALPRGLSGVYALYDYDGNAIRIGISGRAGQDVRNRILSDYYRSRGWRAVHTFSVFTFVHGPYFRQIETLILNAAGRALSGNINAGRWNRGTRTVRPPKWERYPTHFVIGTVRRNGTVVIRNGRKFSGRKVRIEVGTGKTRTRSP
jgi:hypothetical protein